LRSSAPAAPPGSNSACRSPSEVRSG
jgi:hypothetical protein